MCTQIITRKQYMDGDRTHRDYYAQFVTPYTLAHVERIIGLKNLLNSTDEHLNNIPLARWDSLGQGGSGEQLKAAGEIRSLCTSICIHKEAARQIIERNQRSASQTAALSHEDQN